MADPFDEEGLDELRRLTRPSSSPDPFRVSPQRNVATDPLPGTSVPGSIAALYTQLEAMLSAANVTVGAPSILLQLQRGQREITPVETWVVPLQRTYGREKKSVLNIGLTPSGALFAAPEGHASGFGIIPPSYQKTEQGIREISPISALAEAFRSHQETNLFEAATAAGLTWQDIGLGSSAADIEQRSLRYLSGFGGQAEMASAAEGLGAIYFSGSHAKSAEELARGIPQRGEEWAVPKAKRIKAESHAVGVPSGLTPGGPIETYLSPFSYAGVSPEIVARQYANLGISPFGMPGEGMATTHTPMAEIVRGRELELTEQQAAALQEARGKIFLDKKARFEGGLGGMERGGTMRDLYEMLGGQYKPSGSAAILEDLIETSAGKYLPVLRMFAQGSSLKHLFKALNVQAGAGQNIYSVGESRSPIDFDISTRISLEDINMIARASVAANYPTRKSFLEEFFIPQAAGLYEEAVRGEGHAQDVYRRLAAQFPEGELADLADFEQRGRRRGFKAQSQRIAEQLFTERTGTVRGQEASWLEINPAAEELFQALAVRDLASRTELTTAVSPRPVSIEDFSMLLSAGIQAAGLEVPQTVQEQFDLYVKEELHRQTFGAREYERFDPTGIRLIGGESLGTASGVLVPRITAPTIPTWLNALVRPEYFNEQTVIGLDVLETLAGTGRQQIVDILNEQVESGFLPQPARRAAIAHFANVSEESRAMLEEQGVEEFNAAIWSNLVTEGVESGMTYGQATLRAVGRYGEASGTPSAAGYRVRVGGIEQFIPNPADLEHTAMLTEKDELMRSEGSPLAAMGDFLFSLQAIGVDPEFEATSLRLMAEYQQQMDIFFNQPKVQKRVAGIEVPFIGGQINIFQGVPSGIYMPLEDIQERTGMRPEEIFWRSGLTKEELPDYERLTAATFLDPGANPQFYGTAARIYPVVSGGESPYAPVVQEAIERNPRLVRGGAGITPDIVRAQTRDADGDDARIWASMGLIKEGGKLRKVGGGLDVVSREELQQVGALAAGSEVQKQMGIYRETELALSGGMGLRRGIQEAGAGGWASQEALVAGAASQARSQASIGGLYNLYNRQLMAFQAGLAESAGLEGGSARALSADISRLSQGVLQTALDMLSVTEAKSRPGARPETGILNYNALTRLLGMRQGEMPWGPITTMEGGQETQWQGPAGGVDIGKNLEWITKNVLFHMGESFWGEGETPSQDYLNFLPALATGIMSVASIGQPDFESRRSQIAEMIYQQGLYSRGQGGAPMDPEKFLALSGAKNFVELGAGSPTDPGRASVLHGFLTASASMKMEERVAKRRARNPKIEEYTAGFGGVRSLMEFVGQTQRLVEAASAVSGRRPQPMGELSRIMREGDLEAGKTLPSFFPSEEPGVQGPTTRFVRPSSFSMPPGQELEWSVADLLSEDKEAAQIGSEFHAYLARALKEDPALLEALIPGATLTGTEFRTKDITLGEKEGFTYVSGGTADVGFTLGPLKGILDFKTGKSERLPGYIPQASIYGRAEETDFASLIFLGDDEEVASLLKERRFDEVSQLIKEGRFTRKDISRGQFMELDELTQRAHAIAEAQIAAPAIARGEEKAPTFGQALARARSAIAEKATRPTARSRAGASTSGTVPPRGGMPPSGGPPGGGPPDIPPGDEPPGGIPDSGDMPSFRLPDDQLKAILDAFKDIGGGRGPFQPKPPTEAETAKFLASSRYLANVSHRLAENVPLEQMSASGILRNLDVYQRYAPSMAFSRLTMGSTAGAYFLEDDIAREAWGQEDPDIAWIMMGWDSKAQYEAWLANQPGAGSVTAQRRKLTRSPLFGAGAVDVYRQSLREPTREFNISSGTSMKAQALARQMTAGPGEISGPGFTGNVSDDAAALANTFKELSKVLNEVQKEAGGFKNMTQEQVTAFKEGSKAVQVFTSYFNELTREADRIATREGVTQAEAVDLMPGQRGEHLRTLQAFFDTTEQERTLLADLGIARESGTLLPQSRARSMRAMGAYYGMRAMQRTWEMSVQGPAFTAGEYAGLEEGLVAGAGYGPTEFRQLRSAQENAQLRRMYSQYELLGWAGQLGAQLGQIPEVSRLGATAQAGFGAYMSSLLMRENVEALFGKAWMEETAAGRRINAVPGMVGGVALGAMALEGVFQVSNILGFTEDASLGGLMKFTVGGIGEALGLPMPYQQESTSRIAMLRYMEDARRSGLYSAQAAGGITGMATGLFGYQQAARVDLSGRTLGQRLAIQAGQLSVDPTRYAQQIFGIAQDWSPLNREAQFGAAEMLAGMRVPVSYDEAAVLARQQLTKEGQPSDWELLTGSVLQGAATGATVAGTAGAIAGSILPGAGTAVGAATGLVTGAVGGAIGGGIFGYLDKDAARARWAERNITEEMSRTRAERIMREGIPASEERLGTLKSFMARFGGINAALQQVYGREDAAFFESLLRQSGGLGEGEALNWPLRSALGYQRAGDLVAQLGLGYGIISPEDTIGRYREPLAGLQEYQYQAMTTGVNLMAPYAQPGQDLIARGLSLYQGQTPIGVGNILTWQQAAAQRGYSTMMAPNLAQTLGQMEPWRAATATDFRLLIEQMTGVSGEEWGDITETRRVMKPLWATGADISLQRPELAQMAYTTEEVTTRGGYLSHLAEMLSGGVGYGRPTEYQLGGAMQILPALLAQKPQEEGPWGQRTHITNAMVRALRLTGGLYGRDIGEAVGLGELAVGQGDLLTQADQYNLLAKTLGPTAMGATMNLGQVYAGLGFEGAQFARMLTGAGAYTGVMGWQAAQQVAGMTQFGYGMGLQPGQAVGYGYQYGTMFQHPFMAQAFQGAVGQAMGLGAEFGGASAFTAPLIYGSTQLERTRFSGFLSGNVSEYSRMLTGEDRFSANLRAQLERAGINLGGLNPLVDVQTGMSVFARPETMRRAGLEGLSEYEMAYERMMMPYYDERGRTMTAPGGGPMTWQYMRAQEDYQMGRAFTFGGQFSIAGRQYTVPMGALDIQERLFGISTERQQYEFRFQEEQLGIQRRRFEEQAGVSRTQARRRYEWDVADWEYSEGRAQLGFAWQMEDFDEQLRFARGRERRLLMRQRDRATIAYTMERGHQSDIRGRMDEQMEWQEEAFERQKRYYDEDEKRAAERLQRQREFYEQTRQLQQNQLNMERMRAEINDSVNRRELEHANMLMQKNWEIQQQEWNIKLVQEQANAAMYLFYSSTLPKAISSMTSQTMSSFGALFQAFGTGLSAAIGGVPKTLGYSDGGMVGGSFITSREAAQFNQMVAAGARGYAGGGSTPEGPFNKPAGVVHEGEYVVPQSGALVVRGDAQVELLKQILIVLKNIEKKGGRGLAINVNAKEVRDTVSATLDLYDRSYR